MAIDFKVIYLETNQGHGNARRVSIDNASNDLIALMDADDVSAPFRFQRQLKAFIDNPTLDICGGNITEFDGDESNVTGRRVVEQTDELIKRDLKKRCPMNQVSVMFRKRAYEIAGGYIDWYCEEDYYLWARMIQKGCNFANVKEDIVNVRTGLNMSSRRGGWKYFASERKMQRYLLESKLISFPRYVWNVLLRFGGEVLLPNWLRNKVFKITRSKVDNNQKIEEINNSEIIAESYPRFSVAMCVYGKDNPMWFDRALKSILLDQTVKPCELVLVVDGQIPKEIQNIITKYKDELR